MNIGELFVNLGVKGSEKTFDALGGMRKGLKDAASTSLETKAALVGVFYAFEKLLSASSKTGNSLTNFNALTGVTTDTLQRYQEVARDTGSSNEEMAATFKTLQEQVTKMRIGGGPPTGLQRVNELTRDMGVFNPRDASNNPEKLIQRLQAYAQREKDIGFRNNQLQSFGISSNIAALLARGVFNPQKLANTSTYSDAEIKRLNEVFEKWSKLETKITMAFGHFNAKHGSELVAGLTAVTGEVIKMVEAFTRLAEKLRLFEGIQKIFEGWTKIFAGIGEATDFVGDMFSDDPKKKEKARKQFKEKMSDIEFDLGNVAEFFVDQAKDAASTFNNDLKNFSDEKAGVYGGAGNGKKAGVTSKSSSSALRDRKFSTLDDAINGLMEQANSGVVNNEFISAGSSKAGKARMREAAEHFKELGRRAASGDHSAAGELWGAGIIPPKPMPKSGLRLAPQMPAGQPGASSTQNNTINQTMNFQHDGKNAQAVGDSTSQANKAAFRQLGSQTQVN